MEMRRFEDPKPKGPKHRLNSKFELGQPSCASVPRIERGSDIKESRGRLNNKVELEESSEERRKGRGRAEAGESQSTSKTKSQLEASVSRI